MTHSLFLSERFIQIDAGRSYRQLNRVQDNISNVIQMFIVGAGALRRFCFYLTPAGGLRLRRTGPTPWGLNGPPQP